MASVTPPPRPAPQGLLRSLIPLAVGALVGSLLLLLLGPRPGGLGEVTGDPALARQAMAALGDAPNVEVVSVARIRDGQITWAGFGDVGPDSRYELGSITKTFDGLLLADAAARGEVHLTDPVEEYLPELSGTEVGATTLEELASHRAGLPSMVPGALVRMVAEDLAGVALSAYAEATPEGLVEDSAELSLSGRGTMQYSNLGAALLGIALARAAGAPDWPTYASERLFEPLGMDSTRVTGAGAPVVDLMQPHQGIGSPTEPWTGSGYAPAGVGVSTTAADLARFAGAILDGTAPGLAALDARWPAMMGWRIGLAWISTDSDGRTVTWHNGGTGGTRTMLALDRRGGEAVVVLNNSTQDVTGAGFALLGADPGASLPPFDSDTVAWVALGILLTPAFAAASVRGRSRSRILGLALATAGTLLLWWMAAPWDWAPPWIFGLAAGLALAAAALAVRRWTRLPWLPQRWRRATVLVLVLGSAWFAAMLALAGWVAVLRP